MNVLFENQDSCLTPVKTIEEVIKDPVFQESGMVIEKNIQTTEIIFSLGLLFHFPKPL
ncbi:hypothetical protein LEP1GSC150_2911 [Leptospira interrogans serovar Copenhageni str. LT2050]|uniref:Uncharacterized protein n=1 Tax=Leptospira interrogans serovar Copenhageni str. LT2050 TaxID=1001598 RepID=M3GD25_LEPIT|nr:hypothetical protein LEP1GSC150_2911 [Leptospira interrogans serovar Copenhageni str. LT2050]